MIIDSGVNRGNFDSSGLSNGYRINVLMSDAESEILQLTKSIFLSYPDKLMTELSYDWQAAMLARFNELKQKSIDVFKVKQTELLYTANLSLANGFNIGVKEALNQITRKPERQTYSLEETEKGQLIAGQLNGNLLKAEASAVNDIGLKFVESVAAIAAGGILGGTLYSAIDRIFLPKIEKGLTGKITSDSRHMGVVEYSEGLVRESSQTALLAGQGAVAQESGNNYVRISAHASSCPLCTPWQDKILVDDVYAGGKTESGTELLSTAVSAGLFHWNCRHTKTIWIPGFSKRITPPPDYDPDKVDMNYAIEQEQRKYERAIREATRYDNSALTFDKRLYGQSRARQLQTELNKLVKSAREQGYAVYRQNWKEQPGFEYNKFKPYSNYENNQGNQRINNNNSTVGQQHYSKVFTNEQSSQINLIANKNNTAANQVYEKYKDQINVFSTKKGAAYYSPNNKGININLEENNKDPNRTPYKTWFHEVGHHIDALCSNRPDNDCSLGNTFLSSKHTYTDKSGTVKGYTLGEMVRKEANDYIGKKISAYSPASLSKKEIKVNAYIDINTELYSLPIKHSNGVSDIFNGATNNSISGYWSHSAEYWKDKNALGNETFAHMFAANIIDNQDLEYIKSYFPQSYEIFLEILENYKV